MDQTYQGGGGGVGMVPCTYTRHKKVYQDWFNHLVIYEISIYFIVSDNC